MLAACLGIASPIAAQVVAIRSADRTGHGFMLRHGGTCYVILPAHVAGNSRRVTVLTATPVVNAEATVERPFWEGLDLAIGALRGAAEDRCQATLADLGGSASPVDGGKLELVRLRDSGEVDRIAMRYASSAFLTLEAEITSSDEEFFQGTSGAFLFEDDRPVGMVTKTHPPTLGSFIRIEHIRANVQIWLERRAGGLAANRPAPGAATQDSGGAGYTFEVVSADLPPLSPDLSPSNLTGEGAYVFDPAGRNRIVLRLTGTEAVNLRRVILRSDPDGGYALPKEIGVQVSTRADGSSPRAFLSGQTGADGIFDVRHSGTFANWVIITISSAWTGGPVGIEDIRLE